MQCNLNLCLAAVRASAFLSNGFSGLGVVRVGTSSRAVVVFDLLNVNNGRLSFFDCDDIAPMQGPCWIKTDSL
jgi:hypothetical protein